MNISNIYCKDELTNILPLFWEYRTYFFSLMSLTWSGEMPQNNHISSITIFNERCNHNSFLPALEECFPELQNWKPLPQSMPKLFSIVKCIIGQVSSIEHIFNLDLICSIAALNNFSDS